MEENNEPQEEVKEDSDLLNPVAEEAEEADDSEDE